MTAIRFIVGLGNPGSQYKGTRHNIGFEVVDELSAAHGGSWRTNGNSEVSEIRIGERALTLVKPMTFMNRSGQPLAQIVKFFNESADSILIVHDEIDIPSGAVRVKSGGGEGGHNGLKSISNELGTKEYVRVRVGVGRPPRVDWEVSDWVLSRFSADEKPLLTVAVGRSCDAIRCAVKDGVTVAQNIFNRD